VSVAPLGLVAGWEPATVARHARRAAAVMHDDPLVGDGAAVMAMAVAVAATAGQTGLAAPEVFVGRLAEHVRDGRVVRALRRVPALVGSQAAPGRVAAAFGDGLSAVAPVLVAVTGFLRHQRSPWLAVRFAIRVGGDTLAAAAATGAQCGAHLGQWQVPPQWATRLAGQPLLATTAGALASLGRIAEGSQRPQPAVQLSGEARSAVRIGDRPPVGTGSGGRGDR
jgi:ADP-ribosylglycohydrolase